MKTLPADAKVFNQTPVFDQDSIPDGLLKDHQLKSNTWGKINVIKGKLILEFLESGEIEVLNKDKPGIIPPSVFHQVRANENVAFFVEFLK